VLLLHHYSQRLLVWSAEGPAASKEVGVHIGLGSLTMGLLPSEMIPLANL